MLRMCDGCGQPTQLPLAALGREHACPRCNRVLLPVDEPQREDVLCGWDPAAGSRCVFGSLMRAQLDGAFRRMEAGGSAPAVWLLSKVEGWDYRRNHPRTGVLKLHPPPSEDGDACHAGVLHFFPSQEEFEVNFTWTHPRGQVLTHVALVRHYACSGPPGAPPRSQAKAITPGAWHAVATSLEADSVAVIVDGEELLRTPVDGSAGARLVIGVSGPGLAVGQAVVLRRPLHARLRAVLSLVTASGPVADRVATEEMTTWVDEITRALKDKSGQEPDVANMIPPMVTSGERHEANAPPSMDGTLRIHTHAGLKVLVVRGVRRVTGNLALVFRGHPPPELTLEMPDLEEAQDIRLVAPPFALPTITVSLPRLAIVSGDISIQDVPLRELRLPSLWATRTLALRRLALLTRVEVPALSKCNLFSVRELQRLETLNVGPVRPQRVHASQHAVTLPPALEQRRVEAGVAAVSWVSRSKASSDSDWVESDGVNEARFFDGDDVAQEAYWEAARHAYRLYRHSFHVVRQPKQPPEE